MIYKKFLNAILSDKEYLIIKQIDDDILKWEFHFLMERKIYNELPRINSNLSFEFIDFLQIENEFIRLFNVLRNKDVHSAE